MSSPGVVIVVRKDFVCAMIDGASLSMMIILYST